MSLTETKILEIIREIINPVLAPGANDLLDDGAALPPCAATHTRVVSLDAFQEHNDFKIGLGPLQSAGYRAIVQNLSDLAALGAKPVGFLWSLELPELWLANDAQFLREFCQGAVTACQQYNLQLYGGDLSGAQANFSCAITIFGDVDGKPLSRRGAQPGDKIYVSRPLGGSAAGLKALVTNYQPGQGHDDNVTRHLEPVPELLLGQMLVGLATAGMDTSDGLAKDLYRLCKASGVGAKLDHIPICSGASLEQALYGGEDYALLFTASESTFGIEIGEITKNPQLLLKNAEGFTVLNEDGFDHFSSFSSGQAAL
ncbi:MAG: thiamine-phosphate kinase [Myxococcota bacterium]